MSETRNFPDVKICYVTTTNCMVALRMLSFWRRRLPLVANLQSFNTFLTTSTSKRIFRQHNFPFHTSAQEPKTMTHIPESFGNFDLVKRLKLDFTDLLVSKWRSRCTGLTVIHLDYDGILFCLGYILRSG